MSESAGDILRGVKVVEVAQWWFVPAAAALLAEWGADVIKVEDPARGDPMRGLQASIPHDRAQEVLTAQPNRGKRSIGLDLKSERGREILYRLVADADVFITSYLPDVRSRLRIDVDDLRAVNSRLIYGRGTGQGVHGPDAERGGYDSVSFWARGAIATSLTGPGTDTPIRMRGAMGDNLGGLALAGGVAAALFARERTGKPRVVDVSLLATAMWMQSQEIALTSVNRSDVTQGGRLDTPNPLSNMYRTSDGRWIMLCMLQPARFWAEFCHAIGRDDLVRDDRFATAELIIRNAPAAIAEFDAVFAQRSADDWRAALAAITGVWSVIQGARELLDDPQVLANGYLAGLAGDPADSPLRLVASPAQFDEAPAVTFPPVPDIGSDTEQILLELGYGWDDILVLKEAGATS